MNEPWTSHNGSRGSNVTLLYRAQERVAFKRIRPHMSSSHGMNGLGLVNLRLVALYLVARYIRLSQGLLTLTLTVTTIYIVLV